VARKWDGNVEVTGRSPWAGEGYKSGSRRPKD
jgi:hypothetical protein